MDLDFLIERLERYILEESPKLLGNRMVNEEEVRNLLSQVREAVPEEVHKAREIVAQRDAVLEDARRQAERIMAKARAEVEVLTSEHGLVQEARKQASSTLHRAERNAALLRSDADEYVFDTLSQLQGELTRLLRVTENGLQRLESDRERTIQAQNEV